VAAIASAAPRAGGTTTATSGHYAARTTAATTSVGAVSAAAVTGLDRGKPPRPASRAKRGHHHRPQHPSPRGRRQ